ncbi:MAG: hypothetical protein AAF744_13615 [Pseudomonadota bacterium]
MKKVLIALPMIGALAACDTRDGTLAASTLTGAALGAAVSGSSDRTRGAIIGGAAGLAAGSVIARQQNGQCVYQRSDGSRYVAACP